MPNVVEIAVKHREETQREVEKIDEFLRVGDALAKGDYAKIAPVSPTVS